MKVFRVTTFRAPAYWLDLFLGYPARREADFKCLQKKAMPPRQVVRSSSTIPRSASSIWRLWIITSAAFPLFLSPLCIPLHADLSLLAQRGRRLLCQAGQAPPQTWRVLLDLQAAINRFLQETNNDPSPSARSPIPIKSSLPSGAGTKR